MIKIFPYILMLLLLCGCGRSLISFGGNNKAPDPVSGGSITLTDKPDGTTIFTLTQPDNPSEGACFDVVLNGKTFKGNISGVEIPEAPEEVKGLWGYGPIFWIGVGVIIIGLGLVVLYALCPNIPIVKKYLISWHNGLYLAGCGMGVCMVDQFLEEYGTESLLLIGGWAIGYAIYGKGLHKTPKDHGKK